MRASSVEWQTIGRALSGVPERRHFWGRCSGFRCALWGVARTAVAAHVARLVSTRPTYCRLHDQRRNESAGSGKNFATISTLLPSGQIQTHVVWVDCDDDHIVINTEVELRKFKNVQADPRVTVTIWDKRNPYLR